MKDAEGHAFSTLRLCDSREELAAMAKQRQQQLEGREAAWGGPDDYNEEYEYEEYDDYVVGRKACRSSVAVTPGRRPVSRHSSSGGTSQAQPGSQGRRHRG